MKQNFRYFAFILCCTMWSTLCFILPDFIDNPWNGIQGYYTLLFYTASISGATFFLLYLAALNKYLYMVFLSLFALAGAAVSYFRVAFKATITPVIIDATLHTNSGTIAGTFSWQLIGWGLLNLCIAIGFIWFRWHKIQPTRPIIQAIAATLLLTGYYNCNSRLHNSINQRYPYNIWHNFRLYRDIYKETSKKREMHPFTADAVPDSIDIVFIIGEALRADHLGINGYARETTPKLSARANTLSFTNIYSEYTHTMASVPHLLTPADSISPDKSQSYASFICCFDSCGFSTSWISNQDKGRTYAAFIAENDHIIYPNASKSVFVFNEWTDKDLLAPLDSMRQKAGNRNLYTLHTIGSHWYYNNHVPTNRQLFQPVTDNRMVTGNTPQQVINSYDNTVLYMDWFVDTVISRFEDKTAIVIYLSDHGEALGEEGHWLHAGDTEPEKHPACIIWYSDKYASNFPDKADALKDNRDRYYRTDFLFYSILSAAGMEANGNNSKFDIFSKP